MRRKLLKSMRMLLVAAGLCLGASNVWATSTKTLYPTGTTDPTAVSLWSYYTAHITATQGSGYISFSNSGNGTRVAYLPFYSTGSDFYSDYESYTVSFDYYTTTGWANASGDSYPEILMYAEGATIATPLYYTFTSKQPENQNNYLFNMAGSGTTNLLTMSVNGGSEVTYDNTTWYTASITVTKNSTQYDVAWSVKTQDGKTTKTSGTTSNVTSDGTSYKCQGIMLCLGKYCAEVRIANVKVTTEVDEEVVSDPIINETYDGANRTITITSGTSSEDNTVTTYYTTDGSSPTSSSSIYSSAISISENCTVKAVSISSGGAESNVSSRTVTVGKLTLNSPTFTKTAFSAGTYTITIADNQGNLTYVPSSTTIKYRVGTTGEFANYTSGVAVPAGNALYAYVEADSYTNSSTVSISTAVLPNMTEAFGQNYAGVVDAQIKMTVSEGTVVANSVSTGIDNYFLPSSDGTNALTNENISFYFNYNSGDTSQNKFWYFNTAGMYSAFGRGYANVRIDNLTVGQIVVVDASSINSVSGLTEINTFNYGTTHYYAVTEATAYVNLARQTTLYSIHAYNISNEIVGAYDYSTPYSNQWNTTPIWINAGETVYYKIVNYNNGGNAYENWYLFGANESSENLVIFGPNHSNTATNGTYTSKPSFTMADLNGATIELTTTLADAGDGTYTLTTTAVTTKADGSTALSPNLVYTQTGLNVSKLKLYVSVEKSWLELLEQAVNVTVTDAGYATYVNNDNDLDFSSSAIEAYKVKVSTKGVANLTKLTTVPAGTPVLLYKEGGATESIPVITGAAAVSDNDLVAGTGAAVATIDGDFTNMILNNVDDNIGFYYAAGQTVAPNRAYLHIATSLAPDAVSEARMIMVFGDETTGIKSVKSSELKVNGYYNLNGQRVNQPSKGIYIVNGKKVIMK